MFHPRIVLIAVFFSLFTQQTRAQEITLGLSAIEFTDRGQGGAALVMEYRHLPFREGRINSLAFSATATVTGQGDVFIGTGVWSRWQWESGWLIDLSVMPGAFEEGPEGNDLGLTFEIRSLLGTGYEFKNGSAVSASFFHISNASLGDTNPGADGLLLRYHYGF